MKNAIRVLSCLLLGFALFGVLVAILVAGGYGWVENAMKLANLEGFSGMLVLRIIGLFFAPLGVILGYC